MTNDHLGSPRINTDQNGTVTARHDYHPFGEEIATSQRTTALSYTADTVRKQFTGYERDSESGLDFAQARIYSYILGRYFQPDPVGPLLVAPQTLNLYQYCRNNPLRYIDRNGQYERDVHERLVFIIARLAGFSDTAAMRVGYYSHYPDENSSGMSPMGRGPQGYRNRRDWHFTDEARRDQIWSEFNTEADQSIQNGSAGPALRALGYFLHSFADSYSHEPYGPVLGRLHFIWLRV